MTSPDPFDELAMPVERQEPRPSFARSLRTRIVTELGVDDEPPPTIHLPERRRVMSKTTTDVPGAGPGETVTAADRPGTGGGIWAAVFSEDALGTIRFLVDTFGFEEQLVVTADDGTTVVHSQLRWPEGGVVQVGTYNPANPFSRPPGSQGLYVVTADPQSVWERCQAAGLEVVQAPYTPDHDPEGMGFSVRDRDGNHWSFGTYGLGQ